METGSDIIPDWINAVIEGIGKELDEETQERVLAYCGKACSRKSLEILKELKKHSNNLDEVLDAMNKEVSWCGRWVKEGNTIRSICKSCECPLVRHKIVTYSPVLCKCSKGWVRTIFEEVLNHPVKVELRKAIGCGDSVCEFVVEI
jgi:predicted hydrocarbon binding protein